MTMLISLTTMMAFAHPFSAVLAQIQSSMPPPAVDYIRILPELVLCVFGMLVMVIDPLLDPESSHQSLGTVALIGALLALGSTFYMAQYPGTAFSNMIRVEAFSVFFHFLVIAIAAVSILSSFDYLRVQRIRAGEYYGLILFGTVGMCLMSSAVELVLIFIALEISSISTYILAGFRRHDARSSEASLKYFLLGSFATAFLLYGVALIFGATGSTNIDAINQALHSSGAPVPVLAYVATALMFVGLGFKVASAPFHVWTPDVYEGAPSPIVGLMSTGPKAAAFAVLLRVMFEANVPGRFWLIWVSAALSMTLGNLGALIQDNIKRLLAYSSIAHAGYLLVAFAAQPELGTSAAMFYTAAYAAMNVGAFAVVSHLAAARERYVTLEDYAGLGRKSPALAATLTFFLMSLIGIPITGGFFAKFYVLNAALHSNLVGLAIILVLNSALGAYYYLRIIVMMYMREARAEVPVAPVSFAAALAIAICVAATLFLGLMPGRVLDYAALSGQQLSHERVASTAPPTVVAAAP
ncbi:MAG: NADH-quinone oxidoreductase subunit N [Terriglobales bacterium]